MWKLAVPFLFSTALSAALIQVSPTAFEVSLSVSGPAPISTSDVSYSFTEDFSFYYSGANPGNLFLGISSYIGGPLCYPSPSPSCDTDIYIAVNSVNGGRTGAGYDLESTYYNVFTYGSDEGNAQPVVGVNTVEVEISEFMTATPPGISTLATGTIAFSSNTGSLTLIPEPSTWGFGVLGVVAGIGWRRRARFISTKRA